MKHWIAALLLTLALPTLTAAQAGQMASASSNAEKIAGAMTAAPDFISRNARIMEWPAGEGQPFRELRPGNNGWTCLPDLPVTEGNDPHCLDETWMVFVQAFFKGEAPRITRTGIGYMLAPGGATGSATDPFATAPTPDNHWGHDGPHIMMLVPSAEQLSGLPTNRQSGGPYVMFQGTPYVHLMIPVASHPM